MATIDGHDGVPGEPPAERPTASPGPLRLMFAPVLQDMLMRNGSTAWLVEDGWRVLPSGVTVSQIWCVDSRGRPNIIIESLLFPRDLVYLAGYDDDFPSVPVEDFVAPPPHPQDGLEGVVLAGGFEFWSLPLSSGGVMRVTAQGCRRVGGDLQFTVSCVGDPVFDIVLAQVPLGVIEAGVERVLLAEGRPPAACVSEWAPVQQVWPRGQRGLG